jgi:peptidoglycan/LPS O-acetylase OafA/YrhL
MEKVSNRIPSLDGLRTISIAFVLIAHFLHSLGVADILNLGNLGVRVFFIISGFLITGLLLKELEKTGEISLAKFYFRRTMRIFPPYYFFLFGLSVFTLFGFLEILIPSFFSAFAYLTNYYDPISWNLGHTWSLAVEEQFYLIFPGILLIFGNRKTKILLVFIILISPIIRFSDYMIFGDTRWFSMGFHSNMDALGFGCLLSLFYTKLHQNIYYQQLIKSTLICILPAIAVLLNLLSERPRLFSFSSSIVNLAIVLCIDWAVTNHRTVVGKMLNSSPMVYLGTMSYSIYLWQQPFFNQSNSIWTKFPVNIIGLVVMSLISYYLVEKYSLMLRNSLEKMIFQGNSRKNTQPEMTKP